MPKSGLSEGAHYLYVQECNTDYIWSVSDYYEIIIYLTAPFVYAGKDRTTDDESG